MQPVTIEQQHRGRLGSLSRFIRLARWSLRKIELPIRPTDLVLDVGSGSSPHPRADVLLERYAGGRHRHGAGAVVNRPAVFADACRMPFKDKAFDYVIAFHVLEHIPTPEVFLRELMRIAKAGYIETPNVMFERLAPYDVHCLDVMNVDGRLLIHKKSGPSPDPFLTNVSHSVRWNEFFYGNPEYFHVCYRWTDRIDFEVTNPEETCSWYMDGGEEQTTDASDVVAEPDRAGPRGLGLDALRRLYALRRRSVNLTKLLVCPDCRSELADNGASLRCAPCGRDYPSRPWPTFT